MWMAPPSSSPDKKPWKKEDCLLFAQLTLPLIKFIYPVAVANSLANVRTSFPGTWAVPILCQRPGEFLESWSSCPPWNFEKLVLTLGKLLAIFLLSVLAEVRSMCSLASETGREEWPPLGEEGFWGGCKRSPLSASAEQARYLYLVGRL